MYDLRNKLDGKEAAQRGAIHLYHVHWPLFTACWETLLLCVCLASSAFNGPVWKLWTWCVVICMSWAEPATQPYPCSLATHQGQPSPACLCIMEKLFAFLYWSNKQAMSLGAGGWRSGVCVLFSSLGVDKELFDGVERNKSDLGQLIWFTQKWSGHCREQ